MQETQRAGDRFAGRRVVTIGGGSGTFSMLSHLKKYPFNISVIVTMSDSGGSSRMLMDEYRRQLPLGDLRMSLVALARNGALWREVFMHRFERNDEPESSPFKKGVLVGIVWAILSSKGYKISTEGICC